MLDNLKKAINIKSIFLSTTVIITSYICLPIDKAKAQEPAFFCKQPKGIEATICNDKEISQKDALLNQLYQGVKNSFLGDISAQKIEQLKWLKEREQCSNVTYGTPKDCLNDQYDSRIKGLAVSNLLINKELALKTIAQYSPKQLPIYKSLEIYINQPKGINRDNEIRAQIGPLYNSFMKDNNLSYPIDILKDNNIKSLDDGLKNDDNFGKLIALTSIETQDGLEVPCFALYKKPELFSITSAYFGSSYDNQLPYSTCSNDVTYLPEFNKFISIVDKETPESDGTIRFAGIREAIKSQDMIRLGLYKEKTPKAFSKRTINIIKKYNSQFLKASDELYNYYNKYNLAGKTDKAKVQTMLKIYINNVDYD